MRRDIAMRKGVRVLAAGALCGVLAGCAGLQTINPDAMDDLGIYMHDLDAVRGMQPNGPAFVQGLRAAYLPLADREWAVLDYRDSIHFARKAVASAKGIFVQPDELALRQIPEDRVEELQAARARLMAAFDEDARRIAPLASARAQAAFDCWLEQEEEKDVEGAAACKAEFESAMQEVDEKLAAGIQNVYIVFFAWDKADISPVAAETLDQVAGEYAKGRAARLILAGHADRSGPEPYNERLSERRARAVAAYLAGKGVPMDAMQLEWYGERRPRVPTPDGVREPQNRRVEITLQ
jgi:OOP family OmpA-OmpF porin